eukprot:TRINITY_DN2265_c0_g1_i1.p2 TRINITY_DN2265_c0_g1~~TRINITY_DN2265_c0_g1_i1.p2  ORF type:complete len:219 (-),score=51.81 TRINITY_DN2265_c0_g1_i1:70-678(-)
MATAGAEDADEVIEGNQDGYKVSEKAASTIEEILAQDAEDESLRRYKEALLGAAVTGAPLGDPNDPRVVIIKEFIVDIDDRPPLVFRLETPEQVASLKTNPFVLKEGCIYRFKLRFLVQHKIVAGLKWQNFVFKAGIKVFSQEEMIGSYAPGQIHEWTSPDFETPSGMFARFSYKGKHKFIDDQGAVHLKVHYCFDIKRDWQ